MSPRTRRRGPSSAVTPNGRWSYCEQGRGVLLAQVIDARSPRDVLMRAAPHLAERLARLDAALDDSSLAMLGSDGMSAAAAAIPMAAAEHRMTLASERDALIGQAAAFVAPASFADLRRAASDGPVVIVNISRYRCDALIVTLSGVTVMPLDTTAGEVEQMVAAFVDAADRAGPVGASADGTAAETVLAWLFSAIADPVLQHLRLTSGCRPQDAPRLWWCPTGLRASCPFTRPRRGRRRPAARAGQGRLVVHPDLASAAARPVPGGRGAGIHADADRLAAADARVRSAAWCHPGGGADPRPPARCPRPGRPRTPQWVACRKRLPR